MPVVFKVNVQGMTRSRMLIRRLGETLPEAVRDATNDWGGASSIGLETKMRRRLRQVSERWRGEIEGSIKWTPIKPRGNIGTLSISKYGIYLSRMRPHWVALKRGRRITLWARDNNVQTPDWTNAVFVRPHEFIDSTIARNVPLLHKKLKFFADRALKKRGRR